MPALKMRTMKPRLISTDRRGWFYRKQKTNIALASHNLKMATVEWAIAALEYVEHWVRERV